VTVKRDDDEGFCEGNQHSSSSDICGELASQLILSNCRAPKIVGTKRRSDAFLLSVDGLNKVQEHSSEMKRCLF
jgi:hypothetical protein